MISTEWQDFILILYFIHFEAVGLKTELNQSL